MSNLADIRAGLVAQLAAIPGIGMVHNRERFAVNEASFRELFLFGPDPEAMQIRGWWLRRVATAERTANTARSLVEHTWQWRAYVAFNDEAASELVLDELIEAYRDAFRADPTLDGICEQNPLDSTDHKDGVQVVDAGPVTFCGVLCHSAVLQLRTWSYV